MLVDCFTPKKTTHLKSQLQKVRILNGRILDPTLQGCVCVCMKGAPMNVCDFATK